MKMDNSVKIFKALGDKNRLKIIKILESKELCLCEIRCFLKLANSTVSKHLSILKDAGLIEDNKDGKWVNFRLVNSPKNLFIEKTLNLVKEINEFEEIKLEKLNSLDRNAICSKYIDNK